MNMWNTLKNILWSMFLFWRWYETQSNPSALILQQPKIPAGQICIPCRAMTCASFSSKQSVVTSGTSGGLSIATYKICSSAESSSFQHVSAMLEMRFPNEVQTNGAFKKDIKPHCSPPNMERLIFYTGIAVRMIHKMRLTWRVDLWCIIHPLQQVVWLAKSIFLSEFLSFEKP